MALQRWRPARLIFRNKIREINALSSQAAILTWLYVVSMVRAAFKGGGALIPASAAQFRVSKHGRRHAEQR
jgi:hypothetical protein